MKSRRVVQLTALVLVAVAAVQVGWWLIDEHTSTAKKLRDERLAYSQQVAAAQALLAAGASASQVQTLLPAVGVSQGRAQLSAQLVQSLTTEQHRRDTQYAWEGGFFLLALAVCVAVIVRGLRAEARVHEEQDSFLALVSHQFKTPLASLQLSLETLALRTPPPEAARRLIERMLADVARMELMVTQILEGARLERGRVEFKTEAVQLAGAVARVVGQLEERARAGNIVISGDIAPELNVTSDPLALDVVVRNVLENALTAVASAGGGRINYAATARAQHTQVELCVTDTGVGFKTEETARLFEKFTRLHGGSGAHYGTGLGLFIVRRLMELSGGSARAESPGVGQGARLTLIWPAAQAAALKAPLVVQEPQA